VDQRHERRVVFSDQFSVTVGVTAPNDDDEGG